MSGVKNRTALRPVSYTHLTEENVDVKSMNVRTSKKGTATIEMGFIVHGREELERIVKKLQQLSGIIDIERATG